MFVRFYRFGIPLVALALAQPLSAQAPASVTLAASAQVINPVTIAATHTLDFGRTVSGSSKVVAPSATAAGRVEVSGVIGNTIVITMVMPASLKTAAADAISVTGWNFILGQSTTLTGASPIFFNGTTASTSASPDGVNGAMGKLYLGIGATVQTLASSPAGAYSGTGQVTAAYADL